MKNFVLCFISLIFLYNTLGFLVFAQEYPTDRIFMKQFKKAKCLRLLEDKIYNLKKKREMTLEHEVLLNQNIWSKIRAKLPLSPGERKRFLDLKENGFSSKKLSSKKLWAKKAVKFKELRYRCK